MARIRAQYSCGCEPDRESWTEAVWFAWLEAFIEGFRHGLYR
jgi:hypothetical protein